MPTRPAISRVVVPRKPEEAKHSIAASRIWSRREAGRGSLRTAGVAMRSPHRSERSLTEVNVYSTAWRHASGVIRDPLGESSSGPCLARLLRERPLPILQEAPRDPDPDRPWRPRIPVREQGARAARGERPRLREPLTRHAAEDAGAAGEEPARQDPHPRARRVLPARLVGDLRLPRAAAPRAVALSEGRPRARARALPRGVL